MISNISSLDFERELGILSKKNHLQKLKKTILLFMLPLVCSLDQEMNKFGLLLFKKSLRQRVAKLWPPGQIQLFFIVKS